MKQDSSQLIGVAFMLGSALLTLTGFVIILADWLTKDDVCVHIAMTKGNYWQFAILEAIHFASPILLAAETVASMDEMWAVQSAVSKAE